LLVLKEETMVSRYEAVVKQIRKAESFGELVRLCAEVRPDFIPKAGNVPVSEIGPELQPELELLRVLNARLGILLNRS
jgi:hypothetical protein